MTTAELLALKLRLEEQLEAVKRELRKRVSVKK
jgi:hypothetical protein